MSPIKKTLVPVDFSESSIAAARGAVACADRFGSELSLLHVIPDAIGNRVPTRLAEFNPPMLVDQWTRGTRDALKALAVRHSGQAPKHWMLRNLTSVCHGDQCNEDRLRGGQHQKVGQERQT
jgi:nucleotide-binding universal stress UspA family protein